MSRCKIIVRHVMPPIPTRNFDFCAYWDGWEEDGDYGWAEDAIGAVKDLLDNHPLPQENAEPINSFIIDVETYKESGEE